MKPRKQLVKKHQVQHRDRREEAKGKELSNLKRENNHLKRQVARLTKQLTKTIDAQGEIEEANAVIVELRPEPESGVMKCESCKSVNVKTLRMPHGVLVVCKDCHWRKKQ